MNTIASPTLPSLRPLLVALRSLALRFMALLSLCLAPIDVAAQDPDTVTFPERDAIELGAETERAFDRSAQAHLDRPLPNGVLLSVHNGAMQNVTVARLTPDGEVETLCTDSREEALDFLAGTDRPGTAARRASSSTRPVQ